MCIIGQRCSPFLTVDIECTYLPTVGVIIPPGGGHGDLIAGTFITHEFVIIIVIAMLSMYTEHLEYIDFTTPIGRTVAMLPNGPQKYVNNMLVLMIILVRSDDLEPMEKCMELPGRSKEIIAEYLENDYPRR